MDIKKIIRSLMSEQKEIDIGSTPITDQSVIESYLSLPNNPILVSFPRTGSHWLRMMMELYFERPSLVRVFYYPQVTNYLMLHTHDIDLSIERENVIYLYRDPIDTIYSQMNYYKEDIHNSLRISYWSNLYGRHLNKWLGSEKFTKKKTVISYEGLKTNIEIEFAKITDHFEVKLNRKKLKNSIERVTKEEVKQKTVHDPQVVQLDESYIGARNLFKQRYRQQILDIVFEGRTFLERYFDLY